MQSRGNGNNAWERIRKFVTNPTVDVIAVLVVVAISAWVVIESESGQRKNTLPVLFGHR